MHMQDVWWRIRELAARISRLHRRCRKLEQELDEWVRFLELKRQLVQLQQQFDQLKVQPTQLVIEKLENKIEQLHVTTLNGILNIGVALNHPGAIDASRIKIGQHSVADLLPGAGKGQPSEPTPDGSAPADPQPPGTSRIGSPPADLQPPQSSPNRSASPPTTSPGEVDASRPTRSPEACGNPATPDRRLTEDLTEATRQQLHWYRPDAGTRPAPRDGNRPSPSPHERSGHGDRSTDSPGSGRPHPD